MSQCKILTKLRRDIAVLKASAKGRWEGFHREQELRDGQTNLLQKLMDERLRDMNNLRSENREMQKAMLSREEYYGAHQRIVDQLANIWKFIYVGLGAGIIIQVLTGAAIAYFLRGK